MPFIAKSVVDQACPVLLKTGDPVMGQRKGKEKSDEGCSNEKGRLGEIEKRRYY